MNSLRRTRLHSGLGEVDGDLFERSRLARAGRSIVHLAVFIRAIEPVLALVVVVLITTVPALAQTPGGNLFGGNDQQLGSGVREAIRWGRNLLFLLDVGGVVWGAANIMMEKPGAGRCSAEASAWGLAEFCRSSTASARGTRSIWIPIWEIEAGSSHAA
jgi:hypothetical protein